MQKKYFPQTNQLCNIHITFPV